MKFKAQIIDGKIKYLKFWELEPFLKRFKADDIVEVSIKKYDPKRNIDQNALYWKILSEVSKYTGNSKKALHEYVKDEILTMYIPFRTETIVNYEGQEIEKTIEPSTTDLTKKQFSSFLKEVSIWAIKWCEGFQISNKIYEIAES